MFWFGASAALLAVAGLVLGLVSLLSGNEAGGIALLVPMAIVFGWETFADKPLLPWLRDGWRER
jgi:hypothetical protein